MAKKSPISRFESLAQGFVEGSLGRLLGSSLTPADIAARLTKVMEDSVLNESVADTYKVHLEPTDCATLLAQFPQLAIELEAMLLAVAQQSNFRLLAAPEVQLEVDEHVARHDVKIEAIRRQPQQQTRQLRPEMVAGDAQLAAIVELDAYLVVDSRHHVALDQAIINIGRRIDNDIVLDAATVSRRHAQIRWRYGRFVLYDLSQRQGRTRVNGQSVAECVLQPGDVIKLSQEQLLYAEGRTVPKRGTRRDSAETQLRPPEQD